MKRTIIALAFALGVPLFGQPTKQWSHGNPSAEEQYALEVINRIRRDPVSALNFYLGQRANLPVLQAIVDGLFARDANNLPVTGAAAAKLLIQTRLTEYSASRDRKNPKDTEPPKAPYALYPLFNEQAQSQGTALVAGALDGGLTTAYNAAVFFNTGGATLPTKVTEPSLFWAPPRFADETPSLSGSNASGGTAVIKAGVSVASNNPLLRGQLLYAVNCYDPLITLREKFVSGISGTSFLFNALLSDSFTAAGSTPVYGQTRMIGINLAAARTGDPGKGSRVLTVFGTDSEAFQTSDLPFGADTIFITGVVYRDSDKDGDYTPGEGIGGVTITPSSGDWFAITSASGGFAIPVSKNAGVITVTARGTGVNASNVVTVGADSVKLDFVLSISAKPAQLAVQGTDGTNQFVNLSTRGVAEPGDTALIGGFVISGSGAKTVLIRGVAQSLLGFGLSGVLRKPLLTLYDDKSQSIKVAHTQDTYAPDGTVKASLASIFKAVGAFDLVSNNFAGAADGIRPAGDTAIVIALQPGLYSVAITPDRDTPSPSSDSAPLPTGTGTSGSSGLVLLEIYDASPGSGSRFVNLSTRGKIETGARQMIVGFVISGSGHRQLLVRGIGPALKSFGVASALDDSAIELYDASSASIAYNDDWFLATWTDQTVAVSQAVGAFALPDSSPDAVILAGVTPGLYSAAVRSVTGQVGVGLAEIYEH